MRTEQPYWRRVLAGTRTAWPFMYAAILYFVVKVVLSIFWPVQP